MTEHKTLAYCKNDDRLRQQQPQCGAQQSPSSTKHFLKMTHCATQLYIAKTMFGVLLMIEILNKQI